MSSFDIAVLSAQDFQLEVYAAVMPQVKNITDEKIKKIISDILEKHIARALKVVGEGDNEIDKQVAMIKVTDKCQELAKSILDTILSTRLVRANIDHQKFTERNTVQGDILIMSTKSAKKVKASILADLEEYQRCGTPVNDKRPNTPIFGKNANRPDTPVI